MTKQVGVTFYIHIPEVFVSYLGRDTGYIEFCHDFSVLPAKCRGNTSIRP
jgi:hypothetical protein